jgi:MFS superfamily sulfate permease-like transporter
MLYCLKFGVPDSHFSVLVLMQLIDWIILDMSSVSSLDPGAAKVLHGLFRRYTKEDIQIYFAGCPSPVLHVMNTCQFLADVGLSHFFPSIHDAVVNCSARIQDPPDSSS